MSRTMTTARLLQSPDVAPLEGNTKIQELRLHAAQLEIRAHDLAVQREQIRRQQDQASPPERDRFDKAVADAEHQVTVAMVELNGTKIRLRELEQAQQIRNATTIQPPPDPFLGREQIMQIWAGSAILMFPLVLALARRLWVRGGRTAPAADLESSPRLQRMEQAIEAIAVEVERIGESQRFTTKLMAERPETANRIAPMPSPRREPGTVTPH